MSQMQQKSKSSSSYSTPRWVKIFGTVVMTLILILVVLQFLIGGNHSRSRHLPSDSSTAIYTATPEQETQQP